MQENPTFHLLLALGEFALRLVFASIEKFYKEQSDFAKKNCIVTKLRNDTIGNKNIPNFVGDIFIWLNGTSVHGGR